MKKIKRFTVVLMITALFSTSFTSCIDNEVSPLVEAIYSAQADLMAAQTAVQNAEANLLAAQAAAAQAQADYTTAQAAQADAITAGIIADDAYDAAVREQQLRTLAAQTDLNVANAQNALAISQANFDLEMIDLMAQIEAAGVTLAAEYATKYSIAMTHANNTLSQKLTAEASLATAQLMLNGNVSWTYFLAQLEATVFTNQANITALETAIADLEAYMQDPSTPEAQKTMWEDRVAELDALLAAKDAEITAKMNEITALADLQASRDEIVTRYENALADLEDAQADKQDFLDDIALAEADILMWQDAIDSYPADLAAAEDAVATAQANYDAALVVYNDAVSTFDDADAALTTATNNLDDLNAALALLDASYQTAIANLATEQALYDAGIAGANADLVAAQANLAAGVDAVDVAQADYDAKLAVFEADPSGFVWEAGVNEALGLHADATTITASYYVVNSTDDGVDALTLTAGTGIDHTGTYGTYAAFLADATAGALAPGDYYDVGTDDVAGGTNADRLDAAVVALTAAQDAIQPLQDAVDAAQLTVDTFGDALAAALVTFNEQKDLYDNQVALVIAAEDALATAQADYDAADDALTTADNALTTANNALTTANNALAALDTPTMLQGWIDAANADIADWELTISQIQPLIDAYQAVVDGLQAEYDAYIASTGYITSNDADIEAQLITAWNEYYALAAEWTALDNEQALANNMVNVYTDNLADLATGLASLQADLATAMNSLANAQAALAEGQVDEAAAQAYITYLQALVDTLEATYASQLAQADEYYALMQAALAS
ncbi:hypothetical protein Lupro_09215 [Lutibacter profundi]|uniref:Uncharacterized protein n=1 Tax=Lutibacter profundi TaxID=1622118 RepID=A0A0X8G7C5_9FLAO|nr:hypothetical protein [Lutibacter profundi]AMC11431.1 hypothetical protein Lupro_09215 [Lutibacter profundi]